MNPWYGKAVIIVGFIVTIAIRGPHEIRNRRIRVVDNRKGPLEIALLALVGLGVAALPIVAIATPLLAFADYPLHPLAFALGIVCFPLYAWLFYRSHTDLGRNWSKTLQVREEHRLVTEGIYRRIRHPMYAAAFLYGIAQALLLSNLIAGPAFLASFTLMFAFRFRREERMMIDRFGDEYRRYAARTQRLVPGVW